MGGSASKEVGEIIANCVLQTNIAEVIRKVGSSGNMGLILWFVLLRDAIPDMIVCWLAKKYPRDNICWGLHQKPVISLKARLLKTQY